MPSSRGTYLDLIFFTVHLQNIEAVPPLCLLHNNSVYHYATTFSFTYQDRTNECMKQNTKSLDFKTTKLNSNKFALLDVNIPLITNMDCSYYYTNNETFVAKINSFVNAIRDIQHRFTKFKSQAKVSKTDPWKHNEEYQNLVKKRKILKKAYTTNPTPVNKTASRHAHISCFKCYNSLKEKYYSRLINNNSGNLSILLHDANEKKMAALIPMMICKTFWR